MSRRNGDRSRFQINRKRKLRHRQRIRELVAAQARGQQAPVVRAARPVVKSRRKRAVMA